MNTAFAEYKDDGHNWITLSTGEFYPDILEDACALYESVLVLFKKLLVTSESSASFFLMARDFCSALCGMTMPH
jgi:hypothetical protein